jgi:hypothetical protein
VGKSCENCMVLPQGRSLACLNCAKEKIQTLESELQQYKEALRLAVDAEKEILCPPVKKRDCNKWQGNYGPCIECITNYYLTQAKGG